MPTYMCIVYLFLLCMYWSFSCLKLRMYVRCVTGLIFLLQHNFAVFVDEFPDHLDGFRRVFDSPDPHRYYVHTYIHMSVIPHRHRHRHRHTHIHTHTHTHIHTHRHTYIRVHTHTHTHTHVHIYMI